MLLSIVITICLGFLIYFFIGCFIALIKMYVGVSDSDPFYIWNWPIFLYECLKSVFDSNSKEE